MGLFIDITGQKFGRLTAIKRVSDGTLGKWLFRCDCGNEKLLYKQNVCQGKTKSCGCLIKDLKQDESEKMWEEFDGVKFGRLTALNHEKIGRITFYTCKCDCGNQIKVRGSYLKSGHTKSCGCNRIYRHPEKNVGLRKLYYRYSFRSKRYPPKMDISLEEFKELTQKDCFYCGSPPSFVMKSKSKHSEYIYNGLDRINSELGYTKENVVPCCIHCNRMKLDHSQEDFKKLVSRIYEFWIKQP